MGLRFGPILRTIEHIGELEHKRGNGYKLKRMGDQAEDAAFGVHKGGKIALGPPARACKRYNFVPKEARKPIEEPASGNQRRVPATERLGPAPKRRAPATDRLGPRPPKRQRR